jgi:hypothetical protein
VEYIGQYISSQKIQCRKKAVLVLANNRERVPAKQNVRLLDLLVFG